MRTRATLGTVTVCAAAIVAAAVCSPIAIRAATGAGESAPSPCVAESERTVQPDLVLVGEAVSVAMHVRVLCPGERVPLHVVFALDTSDSMAGPSERRMREAAIDLVHELSPSESRARRAAVVEFGRGARTVLPMSGDGARVLSAVRRVQSPRRPDGDETAIDRGILEARREIVAARKRFPYTDFITEVMVVLSDGHDPRGCRQALEEARAARLDGILVVAACIGWGCDEDCMRQVAGSPRAYFGTEHAEAFASLLDVLSGIDLNVVIRQLVIQEAPGEGLAYEPDSAEPRPHLIDRHTGSMRWEFDYVPRDGVSVTYRARVLLTGQRQVATASSCRFADNHRRPGGCPFPEQWLSAWQPDRLAAPRFGPAPDPRPPIPAPADPLPLPTAEAP